MLPGPGRGGSTLQYGQRYVDLLVLLVSVLLVCVTFDYSLSLDSVSATVHEVRLLPPRSRWLADSHVDSLRRLSIRERMFLQGWKQPLALPTPVHREPAIGGIVG